MKQKETETILKTDLNMLTQASGELKKCLESETQKLTPEMDEDKKRKKRNERWVTSTKKIEKKDKRTFLSELKSYKVPKRK